MELEQAKERAASLLRQLSKMNCEIEDGRDEGNEEQNRKWVKADKEQSRLIHEAAMIDIDGKDMDQLWLDAWEGIIRDHEGKYNHCIEYLKKIQELN